MDHDEPHELDARAVGLRTPYVKAELSEDSRRYLVELSAAREMHEMSEEARRYFAELSPAHMHELSEEARKHLAELSAGGRQVPELAGAERN